MKKLLLAFVLSLLPSLAMAQCNGVFPNNTACGNITGGGTPRAIPLSSFPAVTPGGSSGQIQYNNSGALGGFTMNGDCTTNTSTGAITCTTLNGISPFNASNISSGTLNTARLPLPFTNGTRSGNTSAFGTVSGSLTPGNALKSDANGNIVDAGGAPVLSTAFYQLYNGLQPEKLGSAVIAVNPGSWADGNGAVLYQSSQVLSASLTTSTVDFTSNPCTGGMVSGALSVVGATTDGTDVMLYLIHRISDGKVCLVGSNANTYSGVQTQLNSVTGCSPNLCAVDRRVRFAFVWNWATNSGWSGIPDFQATMGDQDGPVFLTGAGATSPWVALSAGSATTFTDVHLGSSTPGSPTTVAGRWLSNLNRRVTILAQCNFGSAAGTMYVITKSGGSAGLPVCASNGTAGQNSYGVITLQTDSANDIQYKVSGTGNTLTLYVIGWAFSDPS